MSDLIRKEPCSKCRENGRDRSGDNMGVYSDGHKFCFSCGYHVSSNGVPLSEIEAKLKNNNKKENKYNDLRLPSDFDSNIRPDALDWLRDYGIAGKEILHHHIGWSDQHERLIFPVFAEDGHLLLWQGRAFSTNSIKPKYSTQGYAENVFAIVQPRDTTSEKAPVSDTIVLVEDFVSAIKVGRQIDAMPLLGSNVSNQRLIRLGHLYKNLIIWLDSDKSTYAIKSSIRAGIVFDLSRTIITPQDPKCYTDKEIQEWLHKHNKDY